MTSNSNIRSLDVTDFQTSVMYLLTQEDSRVAGLCARVETTAGELHTFERISGDLTLQDKTRDQSTDDIAQNPTWDRRTVAISTKHMSTFHEFDDLYKILVNPQPYYTRKHAETINKAMDAIVIAAATGPASQISTDANGNKTTSTVSLPSSQIVDKDTGGADSGLTIEKLTVARETNLINENMNRMTVFLDGKDYAALLRETKATNGDFVTGNPIESGELGNLLGFDFVVYNNLEGAGTDVSPRKVVIMDSEAVAIVTGPEKLVMKTDERPDKSYKHQLYTALTMAAVRLEEKRVIVVETVDA